MASPEQVEALADAEVEIIYRAYDSVAGLEARTIGGKRRIVEPIYRAVIAARIFTANENAEARRHAEYVHDEEHGDPEMCGAECAPFLDGAALAHAKEVTG